MEHHSNIVPWQMICEEKGATLRVAPINERGEFQLDAFEKLLGERTRLVSVVHLSNSLGTINPVREIIELAHARGVPVMIDAAQSAAHLPLDVRELDCDFLAFSGHKIYGPTGIGVLYGKARLLEAMPPYQGGGDMISSVTFERTTYAELPNKFEAGTPNIAGAIGLAAAIDYLAAVGLENAAGHEAMLLDQATEKVRQIPGVRIIGTAGHKAGVLSFVVDELSSLDVGTQLDLEGIAVRTGHHCCQPVMDRYSVPATVRASFALYNTSTEVAAFAAALADIVKRASAKAKPVASVGTALKFPAATAPSPQAAADKLANVFEALEDWSERYQYIIDLGGKLPALPAELKTDANLVRGCQSIVHLHARRKPGSDVLEFLADSNADIVRGLIALLERILSGQKATEVLKFEIEDFFRRLGLDQHLSMGRRNGLAAMIGRLRHEAAEIAGGQTG
jgi:cysteine desulfurase/selenocysteine lyase